MLPKNMGTNNKFLQPLGEEKDIIKANTFVTQLFGPDRIIYAAVRSTNEQENALRSLNAYIFTNPEAFTQLLLPCYWPYFIVFGILLL
jgi:hypothetical protein